jgi:hypothetical protein
METRNARVVGEVTALGYLICVACHPNAGEEAGANPVFAGSPPHSEEECDLCHRVLDAKIEPKPGEVVVVSEIPDCNFCQDGTPGPYDFATKQCPWANGCADHWKQYRASETLGVGKGQLWILPEQAKGEQA